MAPKQKLPIITFDQAVAYLKTHSFDVAEVPGVANQIQVSKYDCGAVLVRAKNGTVAYVSGPGSVIGGEISTLVDRGYQKFLVTERIQVAATADRLRALHNFQEELSDAAGKPDYYNLALGTVSDLYQYDRVKGREPADTATVESH